MPYACKRFPNDLTRIGGQELQITLEAVECALNLIKKMAAAPLELHPRIVSSEITGNHYLLEKEPAVFLNGRAEQFILTDTEDLLQHIH